MLNPNAVNQLLRCQSLFLRAQHYRRAVRIVRTDVVDFVALQAHEAHPDIGLDVLNEVADVDLTIGIGQGGGD